jgi:hypothetical protein
MIEFVKGIFYDQLIRCTKMLEQLQSSDLNKEIDGDFLTRTVDMLRELSTEIQSLINSGDLDLKELAKNNIIRYNTFHERLLTIELFRFLVIMNYKEPEEYFKKKIHRIYKEINCLQKQPIVTTISNSENYYWALPSYDIIAVPEGEERNLLNLPDLFHEMGHLIYNQYEDYLKGGIEKSVADYYTGESERVLYEQRPVAMITFYREKQSWWKSTWIMEFACDMIATYLVGPAYAWTNLKLTTLSSGKNRIFRDSASHPSDEARMRAIVCMLKKTGHQGEVQRIEESWQEFLNATNNPKPANYAYTFPDHLISQLADFVFDGCKAIDLRTYTDQVAMFSSPITKMLNTAWDIMFTSPEKFKQWEIETIKEINLPFPAAAKKHTDAEVKNVEK